MRKNKKYIKYIFVFFLSLLHTIFGFIFYLYCLNLIREEKIKGAIKFLLIVTIRGILSNNLVANISMYSTLKLILMMLVSLYIIINGLKNGIGKSLRTIIISCLIFSIYAFIASFISGSYPVTSMFKIVSFFISFISVLIGVYNTKNEINWLNYLFKLFTPLMIISLFISPFAISRIHNGFFYGVYNHVNMMGIIGAIYIAIVLNNKKNISNQVVYYLLIISTLYMQYLSSSRTGLFSSIIILMIYYLTHISINKIVLSLFLILSLLLIVNIFPDFKTRTSDLIQEFIYKGNQVDILSSRRGLQENSEVKYNNNPIFGSGFMTPFQKNYVNYSLNMSLIVEPGNLLWALLGDVGIIGTILFGIFLLMILFFGNVKCIYLFVTAIVICMGEMVFFSVNNIAVLNYILLSFYIVYKANDKENKNVNQYHSTGI